MDTLRMMRGDSYFLFVRLCQDGHNLTPDVVSDVEVCVGKDLRKTCAEGKVGFDEDTQEWYFKPTQAETLALRPGTYEVIVRVKYIDGDDPDAKGICVGRIALKDTHSKEVL